MGTLKPILTKVSDEEYDAILDRIADASMSGDKEEYMKHLITLPISPGQAAILKRSIGVQGMVEDGINLSRVVEAYGEAWLSD
jgi:hypothetical protein